MKKYLSLLLIVVLVLSMGITFAKDNGGIANSQKDDYDNPTFEISWRYSDGVMRIEGDENAFITTSPAAVEELYEYDFTASSSIIANAANYYAEPGWRFFIPGKNASAKGEKENKKGKSQYLYLRIVGYSDTTIESTTPGNFYLKDELVWEELYPAAEAEESPRPLYKTEISIKFKPVDYYDEFIDELWEIFQAKIKVYEWAEIEAEIWDWQEISSESIEGLNEGEVPYGFGSLPRDE